jgi:hypothetical protein
MHTITTEIIIDTDPASVWTTLIDRKSYREWNPFIRRMDGELAVDRKLTVEIGSGDGRSMRFRPTLTVMDPQRCLAWTGRLLVRGVFDGEHSFTLHPLDGGCRTRFVHSERFSGILVRAARRMLDQTAAGFEEFNVALKRRAELVGPCPEGTNVDEVAR